MSTAPVGEDRLLLWFPPVAAWGLGVAAVVSAAGALLTGTLLPAAGLAGAALTAIFVARPRLAAISFLVTTLTVFNPAERQLPVGPVTLSLAEALFFPALAAFGFRRLIRSTRPPALFTWPVLAYLGAAASGLVVAIQFGDSPSEAVTAFRAIAMLSGYWILRDAYQGDPHAMARALMAVAAIASVVALAGTLLGWDVGGQVIGYVITGDVFSETARLSSPVLRLLTLAIPMAFMGAALARRPVARWLLLLTPMLAAEAASLTRSAWAPLVMVCLALPAAVDPGNRLLALVSRVGGLALLLIVGLALLVPLGIGSAVSSRVTSTVSLQTVTEDSLADRLYEVRTAATALRGSPAMGIGLQQDYGAVNVAYDPSTDLESVSPRRWIHNSLVGVWLWMGALGVAAFLWLAIRVASTAMDSYRAATSYIPMGPLAGTEPAQVAGMQQARVALGAAGGLGALLLQSTFQTNLAYVPALAALATGLAYLDVWSTTIRAPGSRSTRHTARALSLPSHMELNDRTLMGNGAA